MKSSKKQKTWKAKHYTSNKEYYQIRDKQRRDLFKAVVREAKNHPCQQCGNCFHYIVMQFHHRDRATKKFEIAELRNVSSLTKLLEEIAKCDLLCANCHALITWMENQAILMKKIDASSTTS